MAAGPLTIPLTRAQDAEIIFAPPASPTLVPTALLFFISTFTASDGVWLYSVTSTIVYDPSAKTITAPVSGLALETIPAARYNFELRGAPDWTQLAFGTVILSDSKVGRP